MSWQALLLDPLLIARAVDSFMAPPPPVKRSMTAHFLTGMAVVVACLSLIALAVGSYFVLLESYSLPHTLLIMGGGGLLFAALTGGIAWTVYNARMLKAKVRNKVIQSKVSNLLESVKEEITTPIREYPKTAAALAALAGLIVAEKYGKKGSDMLNNLFESDAGREIQEKFKHLVH